LSSKLALSILADPDAAHIIIVAFRCFHLRCVDAKQTNSADVSDLDGIPVMNPGDNTAQFFRACRERIKEEEKQQ
jgi:hypothetical protein